MPLPNIEVIEEDSGNLKHHKIRIPIFRESTCPNCDQKIVRVRDGEGRTRIPPHNRKVFRSMKNGHPDWTIEACEGGKI